VEPSVHQAAPGPTGVISPKFDAKATAWFAGALSAILLIGMVTMDLNRPGGAGGQVSAEYMGSRDTAIVVSQPVTGQPPQQPGQVEVRRALPADTVEVRRGELVVPRAELVQLPAE
jgi:hypothetical protein